MRRAQLPSDEDSLRYASAQPAAAAAERLGVWVPGLLGVLIGTALQLQQAQLWSAAQYAMGAACAALLLGVAARLRNALLNGRVVGLVRVWLVLTGLAAAAFCGVGLRASHYASTALSPVLEGRDIAVTGVVASLPQAVEQGTRFVLRVDSAQLDGQTLALPPLVDLGWYPGGWGEAPSDAQRAAAPRAGERWRMTVRLKAPHGARNPHGFDYELRAWEQGVQAVGYVRMGQSDPAPTRLDTAWRHPVLQLRQHVRDDIMRTLSARTFRASGAVSDSASRAAGVVAALVTGDQRAIDRVDWNVFRATGVAHLVSISGLHITLFAWLAAQGVGLLWRRVPRWCLVVPAATASLAGGLLLATLYAVFSGWGVPAQRTVLMLATVVLLRLTGRRWPWPLVWLLACVAVVLVDPWAMLQPGFWLSFVAVGVLFAIFPIAASASQESARARFHSIFRQQAVVTVALAPLTLLLFGQVSVVGFVANLVAIPWVTMLVTPLAFAGLVWAPLWHWAAWAVQALGWWLGALAALPWAQLHVASSPLWAGLAAALGGVLLVMRLPWSLRLVGVPLCLPVLLWQAPRPPPGAFELLAADIGQGNAVLVRTARHALLYDTGPRFSASADAGERVLVPLLRALGERVDVVMLSHRDNDHSGGAAAVLAQQAQARLTGSIPGEAQLLALRSWTPCVLGQQWHWDGVRFELLHPPAAATNASPGERPNAQSCVLKVTAADGSGALLAGDVERAQEQALVQRAEAAGSSLQATVLLVPHHGSKTSSSDVFLDAVQPRIALVQAAYRSRFGHPAPEVVARYRARGVQVVDSAHCGGATWRSNAPLSVRCERTHDRRYWQHVLP